MNCKTCNSPLIKENMVIRPKKAGYKNNTMPHCKNCITIRQRSYKKTEKKICTFCKKQGWFLGDAKECSIECKLKSHITFISENNCWIGTKSTRFENSNCTASIAYKGKTASLGRVSYLHYIGEINNNERISRRCKVLLCFNPDHLIKQKNKIKRTSTDETKNCYVCNKIFITNRSFQYCCSPECIKKCYKEKRVIAYCSICNEKCIRKIDKRLKICSEECRFISYYNIDKSNNCFIWNMNNFSKRGEPIFICNLSKKTILAAKYSYLKKNKHLSENEILGKNVIVHKSCNNIKCVNPDHIYFDSFKGKTILSKENMLDILDKIIEKKWTHSDAAKYFNCSISLIQNVIYVHANKRLRRDISKEINNYDICLNCSKQHDNIGTQYCSNKCMTEYLKS